MYEFDLPKGAIIEIMKNRYVHMGDGKFTGISETERPNLIEVVSDSPTLENDTVLLTLHKNSGEEKQQYRVIFYAGTEIELAKRAA